MVNLKTLLTVTETVIMLYVNPLQELVTWALSHYTSSDTKMFCIDVRLSKQRSGLGISNNNIKVVRNIPIILLQFQENS